MKNFYKVQSILIILLFYTLNISAQNDVQISQKHFNRVIFNPAAIGQSEFINVNLLVRQQWTGFENAPSSQLFNISNFFEKYKVGVALGFINDRLGYESSQNVKLKYSYTINLRKYSRLSFGAATGFIIRKINTSELIFENINDPHAYISENNFRFDFDLGVEFNTKNFTIGFASTHVTTSSKKATNYKIPCHNYFYTLYNINATEEISVIPSFSMSNCNNIFLFEINGIVNYKNKIYGGLSYRINDAFVIMAQLAITNKFLIGYSYDLNASSIKSFNSGSHEFIIIAKFNKRSVNYNSPRFFD